jgi:hypothetical protein
MARKFKPDEMAVCIESFVRGDGPFPVPCARGTRLKGSHELVRRHPQFFALASLDDAELGQERRKKFEADGGYTPAA